MERRDDPPRLSLEERAGGPPPPPPSGRGAQGPRPSKTRRLTIGFVLIGVALFTMGAITVAQLLWGLVPADLAPSPGAPSPRSAPALPSVPAPSASQRTVPPAPPAPPPAPEPPPDPLPGARAKERKILAMLGLARPTSRRVEDGCLRYLGWCDEVAGPRGTEAHLYAPYPLNDPAGVARDLRQLSGAEPALPSLRPLAGRLAAEVEACGETLLAANEYYEAEAWRHDQLAKGRALHARLVAGWKSYREARRDFEREGRALAAAVDAEILAIAGTRAGLEGEVRLRHVVAIGRSVTAALEDEPLPGPESLPAGRLAGLRELRTRLDGALAASTATSGLQGSGRRGAAYVDEAGKALLRALGDLLERCEGGRPFSAEETRRLARQGAESVKGGAPRTARAAEDVEDAWLQTCRLLR